MSKVLHIFKHGLGDAVQFTSVLRHLRHYRPNDTIDVAALRGKHSVFNGLANRVINLDADQYDKGDYTEVVEQPWHECFHSYPDCPSTKLAHCLRDFVRLQPIPELMRYQINIGEEAKQRAAGYANGLGKFVCIHAEGNTSTHMKNLDGNDLKQLCNFLLELGLTPVILDWDRRSSLPDGKTIFCPDANNPLWQGYGTGDGETLAALMSLSVLNVCIDSGPQKIAMALDVPLICVWTRHHPCHYADLAGPNVWHLIPSDHEGLVRGDKGQALAYFASNYQSVVYKDRIGDCMGLVTNLLSPAQPAFKAGRVAPFVVGIPTLCRYELLDQTIEAVFAGTAQPERVLILDNGGRYQAKRQGVEVVRPGKNLGVAASWNVLLKLADPLECVLMNDDLVLGNNVLEQVLLSDSPCACAAGFSCFRLLQWVWRKVGDFDENLFPAYFEDNDYAKRLKLAGFEKAEVPCDGSRHAGSATINSFSLSERARFQDQWEKNRSYYIRKWGGMPERETYNRPFNQGEEVPTMINILREEFERRCNTTSDINEHLRTLYELGRECQHITEFGVGHGNSTVAWLYAQPAKLVCYDVNLLPEIEPLKQIACKTEFVTHHADDRTVEIEETDCLFIDTVHRYDQLQTELQLHGNKARKFLAFHDTISFGQTGEGGAGGIVQAIGEFISANPHWHLRQSFENNNGLLILQR